MMTITQIKLRLKAQPFRPFRIHMISGRTYDVSHPELVEISGTLLLVHSVKLDTISLLADYEAVSILLIESLSFLSS